MKDFLKDQFAEIQENKLRFGFLVMAFIAAIIFAVTDSFERGEDIDLESQKISQVDTTKNRADLISAQSESTTNKSANNIPVSAGNVKAVIGANADEIYIYDPFKNPNPAPEVKAEEPPKVEMPVKEEEKTLPPVDPVIIIQPAPEIPTPNKVPEVTFILDGVALGDDKFALVKKVSDGKVIEMLFLKIGDELNGKKITDMATDFLTFDDGNRMYFENKE